MRLGGRARAFRAKEQVMKRRRVLASIVLLAAMLAGRAAADDTVVRLGIQPAPVLSWVVKEKGLLEKRGFSPQWTVFPYAAPELEAMAAGSIDLAVMGTLPIVMVALKDSDIWYIYDELGNGSGMVVGASSPIRTAVDLKGKKIAFPGKASQQYGLLMSYLGAAGLSENDVDLIKANVPDMQTLLQKGEIDGFLGWAPYTSEAVRKGVARLLWTADDLQKLKAGHWLNAGWAVRVAFAKANPRAVEALIAALHEATGMLRSNPDAVIPIFAKATGLSPEASRYVVTNNHFVYFDPEDTLPSVGPLKAMFELLARYNVVPDDKRIDQTLAGFVHPEFDAKVLAGAR
jgi:ABC-type nitrate/sulfonate/bicarbonate transport system substrate-binding protein